MKISHLPAAALLLCPAHPVDAGEVAPVIVTATRTAQTADETLAPVTVITRQDIERRQAQSVQDLLHGMPGVNIANNGGPGKVTSLFLRGAESDQVLVLIDGVKAGSATTGTTAFQDIPVEMIDRIEIVRGPRSSLYGSEAIGGVIQIFTRKGGGGLKPSFSLGAGSYSTYNASAGVSGGGARGWYNLSASGRDTEGFNACDPDLTAGCFAEEPDKDGYQNLSATVRGGYRFGNGVEVDAHLLRTSSDAEFDGTFLNESESEQRIVGGTLSFSPLDTWLATLSLGQSRDDLDSFKDGDFQTRFDTRRDTVSLQNDITIASQHLLTLGADYQDDRVRGTTAYMESSRDDTGLYAQYQGAFGFQDVQLSLRRDDNEQFGDHTTGGAAWGYAVRRHLRLLASYGTAFKAPSFNELYFPGFGNPGLDPEESRNLEIGLSGDAAWGHWSLNAYETKIDDLIQFDAATSLPANIARARIRGVETILGAVIAGWDFDANLTLLDPKNRTDAPGVGNVLPRRARQSMRIDADRDFGRFNLGASLVAAGKRYDDLANTRELDGYAIVDLRAGYILAGHWLMQARIENLFDKDYRTAALFNQPGRGYFVTLRYRD